MSKKSSSLWQPFIPELWLCLKQYSFHQLKQDLFAGLTVGIIALPLAMAFAIASGLSPEKGIYTAIIAGFFISLLGGSRLQIGGPTGAFVVIVFDIVSRRGQEGLILVTILAGILLIIAAFLKLGKLIKYIPHPLVTGFTTGIAVIIFSSQIKDFFGLSIELPQEFIPKWLTLFSAFNTLQGTTLLLSIFTLGFILFIRRFYPSMPWGIFAVILATLFVWVFHLPVETISSRFGAIPHTLPIPSLPSFSLSSSLIIDLLPDALIVAFLAGIESLLSAVVADGMAGTKHNSHCELMGQGIANITSVLFGGIPATGAIARTVTNIKSGAKTPLAGVIHSLTILFITLTFAPIVSKIPLAALSAILIVVAWNMSEMHHFRHLLRAPKKDIAILLTTFLFTVFMDLTVGVLAGILLSFIFSLKKMKKNIVGASSIKESISMDKQK